MPAISVDLCLTNANEGVPVQGLLALDLILDTSESGRTWKSIMPNKHSMMEAIPFWWDTSLQALLPGDEATFSSDNYNFRADRVIEEDDEIPPCVLMICCYSILRTELYRRSWTGYKIKSGPRLKSLSTLLFLLP